MVLRSDNPKNWIIPTMLPLMFLPKLLTSQQHLPSQIVCLNILHSQSSELKTNCNALAL